MDLPFRLFHFPECFQQCPMLAVASSASCDDDAFSCFLLLFCALVMTAVEALDLALTENKKKRLFIIQPYNFCMQYLYEI